MTVPILDDHEQRIANLEERVDGLEPGWRQVLEAIEKLELVFGNVLTEIRAVKGQVRDMQKYWPDSRGEAS